jgi:hypothetical protein
MSSFQDAEKPEKPSLLKRGLALLVLAVVVVIAVKILFSVVAAVFWIVLGVVVVVAVLWALNQLL